MLETFAKLPLEKQTKILDAAAGVFAEKGYYEANISSICQRAGISNGALYKYFRNKESLFLSVLEHGVELMVREYYQKYTDFNLSTKENIYNLLRGIQQFAVQYPDYVAIYSHLGSGAMNKFAFITSERIEREAKDFFVKLIEKGQQQKELSPHLDSTSAAFLVDSYITLYAYSLVSEYHKWRFDSFFAAPGESLSEDEKIEIIMHSINDVLK
jgi:TetR/AcrR family transcriptional regulator